MKDGAAKFTFREKNDLGRATCADLNGQPVRGRIFVINSTLYFFGGNPSCYVRRLNLDEISCLFLNRRISQLSFQEKLIGTSIKLQKFHLSVMDMDFFLEGLKCHYWRSTGAELPIMKLDTWSPLYRCPSTNLKDFSLLKVLGKGSFGIVYLCRYNPSGQKFALKVIPKDAKLSGQRKKFAFSELKIMKAVRHPLLLPLFWAFKSESHLFLITAFLSGGALSSFLERWYKSTGGRGLLSEAQGCFLVAQVILAVGHLHSLGILHRDLKLDNLLMDKMGYLRVGDFGLSREGVADNMSAKTFCGTPEYLAPEVLKGEKYGRAADWWSIGVILHEVLTGKPPFYHSNTAKMYQQILTYDLSFSKALSHEAKDLISQLLEKDASYRLGSGPSDAEEIKKHPFFEGVCWDKLLKKRYMAPYRMILPEINQNDVLSSEDSKEDQKLKFKLWQDMAMAKPIVLQETHASLFEGFPFSSEIGTNFESYVETA